MLTKRYAYVFNSSQFVGNRWTRPRFSYQPNAADALAAHGTFSAGHPHAWKHQSTRCDARSSIRAPFAMQSLSDQEGFEVRPKFDGRLIRCPLRRNYKLLSHAANPVGHAGPSGHAPDYKAKYYVGLRQ
jgi:hypothetical protein